MPVSERVGDKVDELQQDLGDVLSSEQFQKIEGLLDSLNGELIASIGEGIVDKLGKRLNVTSEQLQHYSAGISSWPHFFSLWEILRDAVVREF